MTRVIQGAGRVVWKRKVQRSAKSVADGGIGLEIEGASEVYSRFIKNLLPEARLDPSDHRF